MKKKLLLIFLAIVAAFCLALGFTACDETPESGDNGKDTEQTTPDDNIDDEDNELPEEGDGQLPDESGNGDEEQKPDGEQKPDDSNIDDEPTYEIIEGTAGLEYTLIEDGTYALTGLGTAKDEEEIVVANLYNGIPVTRIGLYNITSSAEMPEEWLISGALYDVMWSLSIFKDARCAKVTIPYGITTIGSFAFGDCLTLESVTIPDSVTTIGFGAFFECSSLTSATIPNSVTALGEFVFSYCSSLTSVTIPDGITTIGGCAFDGCNSLTSITIPDSVTIIGYGAFTECDSLTSVTIGNSVTIIGYAAFWWCNSLTSITIPDSVTTIDGDAFWNCSSLTSVIFENTSGWRIYDSSSETSGTRISSEDLADPATAATYLTDTYCGYYWKRG